MRLSITLTDLSWRDGPPAGLRARLDALGRAVDGAGLDTLWIHDHLMQVVPGADPTDPVLEAYTALGYLAGRTTRVRLGALVSPATLRPAAMLIKAVTTLDVLSGGRAWFGIGAGYHHDEARALDLPLPPPAERYDRLADTLTLARRMWAGDDRPFHAPSVHLAHPVSSPAPLTSPHPPILIGGMGERRTLPLVARLADAANLFDIPDGGATLRRKIDVLARCCEDIGRDPDEIEKTASTRLTAGETADALTERCHRLAELGIDHTIVLTAGPWTEDRLAVLATARQHLAAP